MSLNPQSSSGSRRWLDDERVQLALLFVFALLLLGLGIGLRDP